MDTRLKDILVIDIETASAARHMSGLSEGLQEHWKKKASFLRNEENLSPEELYDKRAAIYAEFGKVIVISLGIFYEKKGKELGLRIKSFYGHDEKQLLQDFKDFLEARFKQDKLRFCAHNGKEFDYPYLCRRMLVNGITIPPALDLSGKKPWEVQHLDTMEMWKFGDRKSFTSLDLMATALGVKSSKSEIDGSMVNEIYYNDQEGLDKIAYYCRGDVTATAQVYLRLKGMDQIKEQNIIIVA
jgi:uncharacterized protein YprB with RNaseH-like and TPR domain